MSLGTPDSSQVHASSDRIGFNPVSFSSILQTAGSESCTAGLGHIKYQSGEVVHPKKAKSIDPVFMH